jgi:hypothetical protein
LLNSAHAESLFHAAEVYLSLGYSVIPLYGDTAPDRPKVPALSWGTYQSRHASLLEARQWFMEQGLQGIGLVTGHHSHLAVLDFDSDERFQAFANRFPYLLKGHLIRTRRGHHIYFKVPFHLQVTTRKGQGVDLLSDGCYAVAPPTAIDGFVYEVIQDKLPKSLTALDLACINLFLDECCPQSGRVSKTERPRPTSNPKGNMFLSANPLAIKQPSLEPVLPKDLIESDLHNLYRFHIGQGRGRNQALFYTAITARDHGWSQMEIQTALADLHVRTLPLDSHSHESEQQRLREADHTIRSAFSRPPRPARSLPINSSQLPTRIRESFFAQKLTYVVRLIEGLREKGVQAGQCFTRKQARQLLLGIVGRDSLDHALNALTPGGKPLIRRASPSLEPSPASVDAADEKHPPNIQKMLFERAQKSGQLSPGPKPRYFVMPSNAEIGHLLDIRMSSSDPLEPDDLRSAKKTRQAAHRELIKRRPAQYHRSWLAKRLGVSIRTLQTYNLELKITVRPIYDQQIIMWSNLNAIPDFPVDGLFLLDENNKRYPAKREIAARLLNKGHTLDLVRQRPNYYSLDPPHLVHYNVWQIEQAHKAEQERIQQRIAVQQGRAEIIPQTPARPAARPRSGLPPPEPPILDPPRPQKPAQPKPAPRLTKRRARQPLPDAHEEALAQRVYITLNNRTPDPRQRISQATARRCVFKYGSKQVEQVLGLVQRRHNVIKPAGFFMTVLRSESKVGSKRR